MATSRSPDISTLFGQVLQRYRSDTGISQEELAHRAGVDRTFISRLERGVRQPTITTLIAVGAALGTSATELVRATEKELDSGTIRRG
jgi:transcriptional regulator with XRE-family HTH domain